MKTYALNDIRDGSFFSDEVFLDDNYILLSPDTPVNSAMLRRLQKWHISQILSEGKSGEKTTVETEEIDIAELTATTSTLDSDIKEHQMMNEVSGYYKDLLEVSEQIFTSFVTKGEIPGRILTEPLKKLIDAAKTLKRYLLRINDFENFEKNYIVVHSVKTTILAIIVGQFLHIPAHRLIELGMAAMMHEIGMIRLPPQLYNSNRKLNGEEKKAITAHPILGFKILKANNFPLSVCTAVLEHHEYLDGSGYPRGLTGDKVSEYPKIIGACSTYAALVSERPYRPGNDAHNSILDLLRSSGTKYDKSVITALVNSISIFPIGSMVELSNGAVAKVVEVNESNPKFPTVKVFTSSDGIPLKDPAFLQTAQETTFIRRSLTAQEIKALSFLQ